MNETVYSIIDNKGKFIGYNSDDDFFYSGNSVMDTVSLATTKHAERMTERLNTYYANGENLAIDDTEYPVKAVKVELNYEISELDTLLD